MNKEIEKAIDNLKGVVAGKYRMDEAGLDIKDIEISLDYITNLEQENEIVHKDFSELSEKYFFTKSRNEKAIEYIGKRKHISEYHLEEIIGENSIKELLNILKGGDEK